MMDRLCRIAVGMLVIAVPGGLLAVLVFRFGRGLVRQMEAALG